MPTLLNSAGIRGALAEAACSLAPATIFARVTIAVPAKMYQQNLLAKPGGITLADAPIDLSKISTPTFILATREDHIAPWKSTYAATRLYSGPLKFVLTDAGHMAGVVSPPGSKYGHWTNDNLAPSPDEWFSGATSHLGSWWPVWDEWVTQLDPGRVSAREPGGGKLRIVEDAPGSYVRVRWPA